MTSKKQARGSEYSDYPSLAAEPVDLHFTAETKWETIGFRLVSDGADRVFRGGSWVISAQYARVALRFGFVPSYRDLDLGFRLARDHNHQGDQHEKEE